MTMMVPTIDVGDVGHVSLVVQRVQVHTTSTVYRAVYGGSVGTNHTHCEWLYTLTHLVVKP